MANKQDYLARLQLAIEHLHACGATYAQTVPVHEIFKGQTVWEGDVEVFDLHGHNKAKRCYGWNDAESRENANERFVTVLEIPPVKDAQTAVQVAIVRDVKQKQH